ncbi:MAG: ATP phosphoribosyltransferase regulatory subunit, partial [Nanoarchaeota archaeon]
MKTDLVKGFIDYVDKDAQKRAIVQEVIKQVFEKYNFEIVETPIIEYEEFVKGENQNDDAISDIFKLQDKGKRKLALRYEFTFQLKRIAKNKKLPFKRFQIGQVFRDEPVTGNRLRQFTQCDVDVIGSSVKEEAEILAITKDIFDALKIKSVIYVNNRKLLNEILGNLGVKKKDDVIREIDKLDKLPEKIVKKNLEKYNAEKIISILKKDEKFFEKFNGYKEVKELKEYCKLYGVVVKFSPFLARGLSYYNGNVFEIKSDIKETICGGGSYEIDDVQSTGISFGLDRLQLVTKMIVDIEKYLVVSLNQDRKAISVAKQLRAKRKNASVFYGKPSKALEYANSYGIKKVIFVGEREVK